MPSSTRKILASSSTMRICPLAMPILSLTGHCSASDAIGQTPRSFRNPPRCACRPLMLLMTCLCAGELDREHAALRQVIAHGDASTVISNDAVHDRQPQARPALFSGEIWQEQLVTELGRNTDAGITYVDTHMLLP